MTDNLTLNLGNRTIGRAGLVCALCHTSLAAKTVHEITPPKDLFVGLSIITVCAICKENQK